MQPYRDGDKSLQPTDAGVRLYRYHGGPEGIQGTPGLDKSQSLLPGGNTEACWVGQMRKGTAVIIGRPGAQRATHDTCRGSQREGPSA